ncbi:TIGR02099 family protein, partial [Turicibacter sanguinis]|nr:TIGR02099 family protein [Turicibacter sanguinis]
MTDNSEQQTSTTPTKPKKGFFGYAWRTILWFLVILYFALGAAWLGARYCLAPYLNDHKSKIENKISQVLDIPVQFGSLDTDWQGLSPEITLKNIELGEPGKDPITAESLTAKLSLSSLTNLTPIFESVTLNNPKVEVRRLAPMSFSVLGRKVNLKKLMSGETETQALTT